MAVISKGERVCETCGSPIETTSAGDLGCIACLIASGLDAEAEQSDTAFTSPLDRLGAYTIEHHADGSAWELGRGAMGVTYRAIDKALDRAVALKIINTDLGSHSAEARERFMREARAAAALRHPNVATVYQFGVREETGQFFYAMELVEGETLEERVRRLGPLDVLTTIDIALQVTAALEAAEERGLVHRDLKPGNLMLVGGCDNGDEVGRTPRVRREQTAQRAVPTVKVIDFGVAKAVTEKTNAMAITHGGFVGTPAFASPEQFTNAPVDVRSDIYSLGVTLWFLLTGHMLFSGRAIEEIQEARRSKPLPSEQLKAAHVPRRLISLLTSMLAIEPAVRPAGARELSTRLQAIRASISGRGKTAARLALAAAIVALATMVTLRVFHSFETKETPAFIPKKSIAVLPFENLSNGEENAFFADGVQDEILTDLSRIADLKVISRTSVMTYKSRVKRNLRQIANELGVTHIVEGSVQRAANRVRVNAQLIDARNDAHVWAQTYDRDLADVFAIQSDIAKSIAEQLQARLLPTEKNAIERPPTSDLSAFDLYARANNLILESPFSSTEEAGFLKAAELLNQAVARDPSFFAVYCQLAHVHLLLYFFAYDHTAARLALAEAAVQAASRLRPDAGETHVARALNLYRGYLDYDGALAELELARRTLPNNSLVFNLMAAIQRRQGRWQECIQNFEHSSELDPRNIVNLRSTADTYAWLRRYAEEKSVLDRILVIEPDDPVTKAAYAFAEFSSSADTRPLGQLIDSIRATNQDAIPNIVNEWLTCALAGRDGAGAKEALVAFGERPVFLAAENIVFNRPFVEGVIARMAQDNDKARSAFRIAREAQEKVVQAQPNYGPALCVLGLIDAGLGRKEEALREGQRAVDLLPVRNDALGGMQVVKYLAMIAAWVGDEDLACEQLAITIHNPGGLSYGELKLLPYWDPLRGDPRFEKLVEEAKQPTVLK
jgi:TolB-like protein/tRNA A-37 threonylcarbamoyl transferase component Bud32